MKARPMHLGPAYNMSLNDKINARGVCADARSFGYSEDRWFKLMIADYHDTGRREGMSRRQSQAHKMNMKVRRQSQQRQSIAQYAMDKAMEIYRDTMCGYADRQAILSSMIQNKYNCFKSEADRLAFWTTKWADEGKFKYI